MKLQVKEKGRVKYYFLSVPAKNGQWLYHEWYTLTGINGIVNFPECVVKLHILRTRVGRLGLSKTSFKDLWDCITRPIKPTFECKEHDYAEKCANREFNDWLMLMKVGSLTGKILQGKTYEQ